MDIPIVELEDMPLDEIRALNMPAVQKRFAILYESRAIALKSEITEDGNAIRITATVPKVKIIDYLTGKILS